MKVHELLSEASKWTRGAMARQKKGGSITSPTSADAACWCLAGAIERCYTSRVKWRLVRERVEHDLYRSVVGWNDAPGRTFKQVRDLVTRLDI